MAANENISFIIIISNVIIRNLWIVNLHTWQSRGGMEVNRLTYRHARKDHWTANPEGARDLSCR